MIDISKGRYWDLPWSLVSGCTPCSPGCERCWALAIERRFKKDGLVHAHRERLSIPIKRKKPTVYALWNDLFHAAVPDSFIHGAFAVMTGASRHTFLILTKRMERMADFVIGNRICENHYTRNIWFIPTVCNQDEADRIVPILLKTPAAHRGLSIEPMLGPVDVSWALGAIPGTRLPCIDAVILGGETGPGARPMHPDWVRSVRDQCAAAGVPFFFKGWGAWKGSADFKGGQMVPGTERKGRLLDGRTHDDLPWVKT